MIQFQRAVEIAAKCEQALRIAGQWADVPYSQAQLCEALAAYKVKLTEVQNETNAALKELQQKHNAALARLGKYEKRTASVGVDANGSPV